MSTHLKTDTQPHPFRSAKEPCVGSAMERSFTDDILTVFIHTYFHICIDTHTYKHIGIDIHTFMHRYIYTRTDMHTYLHSYTYMHAQTYKCYINIFTYIHRYTQTRTYMHTYRIIPRHILLHSSTHFAAFYYINNLVIAKIFIHFDRYKLSSLANRYTIRS